MSWVAVAIAGAGVLGYVGSQQAASTQAGAQQQAAATQQQMFNTINQQEQPFMQAGYGATTALSQLLGLPSTSTSSGGSPPIAISSVAGGMQPGGASAAPAPSTVGGLPSGFLTQTFNPTQQQLESYPGYQFQLQTGAQGVQNANTPGSGALSGAALKSLAGFNQGVAASNYANYFNQFQTQQNNIFSRLSGIAGLGQNAATNVGTQGTALGTRIAVAQAAAGASQAAGIVGGTNALSGGLNNAADYLALRNNLSSVAGPGTGAYTSPTGAAYNNPSAYNAGG